MRLWPKLSHKLGKNAEQQAKDWLQRQGLQVIAENFHCKGGEIDLIALENKTLPAGNKFQILVFIEVKYRKSNTFGHALEFVTPQKQDRVQKCAQYYLLKHAEHQNAPLRFDVIAIEGENPPQWIQNAF